MKNHLFVFLFLAINSCLNGNDTNNRSTENGGIVQIDSTYYKKGYKLSEQHKFEEANKYLLKSAQIGFKNAKSFFHVGLNYAQMGEDSLALIYLQKSLELDSTAKSTKNLKELIALTESNLFFKKLKK